MSAALDPELVFENPAAHPGAASAGSGDSDSESEPDSGYY